MQTILVESHDDLSLWLNSMQPDETRVTLNNALDYQANGLLTVIETVILTLIH